MIPMSIDDRLIGRAPKAKGGFTIPAINLLTILVFREANRANRTNIDSLILSHCLDDIYLRLATVSLFMLLSVAVGTYLKSAAITIDMILFDIIVGGVILTIGAHYAHAFK